MAVASRGEGEALSGMGVRDWRRRLQAGRVVSGGGGVR